MRITKVEISNILGVKSASLTFSNTTPVYVVQCDPNCPIRSTFSTAIELIVSAKYSRMESICTLTDIYKGFVCLTFNVTKEDNVPDTNNAQFNEEQFYELVACRDFTVNADTIEFSINNQTKQFCSSAAFLAKFFNGAEFLFPYLNTSYELSNGNLLHFILRSLKHKWQQDQELFEVYIESHTKIENLQGNNFMKRLTTGVLNTCITNYVTQKCQLIKICNDIRTIFEFITCDEYSVWFFIPCNGEYRDMNEITISELDLDAIQTCVQLKNCDMSGLISWLDLNELLKECLLIALDLALRFSCKQNIVFIRNIHAIKEHQAIELYSAAYSQGLGKTDQINCDNKNYLQRVIDVCKSMGVIAIIEYSASLPVHPTDANIITCMREQNLDEQYWTMTTQNTKIYDFENLVTCIRKFF